jgi:hypothetical protein
VDRVIASMTAGWRCVKPAGQWKIDTWTRFDARP